jgi:phenylalanyl-tRNA synthetase beta chain
MKISYRLLNEYIDLQSADPYVIAPAIAEHCFEVEFIHEVGGQKTLSFTNVFAAEVLHVEKHPNADRLRVVKLNLGDRIVEPVVCGAWNFEAGDMVALALPGAHIPQDVHSADHVAFDLGTAKIRGIESQGMICSGFELGIQSEPEEKPEILILPKDITPGTNLLEYFNKQSAEQKVEKDYLLDFAMPANRPDLHSHIGVAQELSGMLGYKKTKSMLDAQVQMAAAESPTYSPDAKTKVQIKSDVCGMYLAARMQVAVGQTAPAILNPLRTLGHDGVNNVVDITNFVMIETGQPLHAYDAAQVHGDILVRSAASNETVVALDGKEYKLPETALVISDDQKALGIAGIIGGNASKILPETKEIILEVALFDRVAIRKASKGIGLRTDASGLFEKGTMQQQAIYAFQRAIQLLEEYADGVILEIFGSDIPEIPAPRAIHYTADQINAILGGEWTEPEIKKILHGLGIEETVPWYRQDIEDVAGLADEVVRFVGMNTLPKQPLQLTRSALQYSREAGIWKAKDAFARIGFVEVQGYSFVSAGEIAAAGRDSSAFIKVSNPLSAETEYLRRDLGEGLLKIVGSNAKHTDSFKLFEIGFGYHGYDKEQLYAALAIYKRQQTPELQIAEIKGDLQAFMHEIGVPGTVTYVPAADGSTSAFFDLHNPDSSVIKQLGVVALIDPGSELSKRYDIDYPVIMCQFQLDTVLSAIRPETFHAFSRFPESSLDLSIVVAEATPWQDVESIIRLNSGALLKTIEMLDAAYYYTKATMPTFHKNLQKEGRKNLVFRLVFAQEKGTLQDSEISAIYAKIKVDLESKLSAEIR